MPLQSAAVVLLVAFSIFCVLTEFARQRAIPFDFFSLFNLSYLVYFVLAPLHLILGGERYTFFPEYLNPALRSDDPAFFVGYMTIIIVTWFLVAAGYRAGQRSGGEVRTQVESASKRDKVVFAVVLGVLGLVSVYVFAAQYGGLEFALRNASFIRGRAVDSGSSLLFLRNIAMFLPASALLVLSIFLDVMRERRSDRYLWACIAAVTLGLALVALALQGSRRAFLIFFAGAALCYANYRGRMFALRIGSVAVLGLVYVAVGDLLNRGLDQGLEFVIAGLQSYWEQGLHLTYAAVWRDFSLPVIESWAVLTKFDGIPRFLIDVPIGVLELIPERLFPVPLPQRLSDLSTLLIGGQGVDVIAEIPPGFIGFFWYSGYALGLVAGPVLFGYLGGYVHRRLLPHQTASAACYLTYTLCAFLWAYFLREGIPYMLFVERFHWFVLATGLLTLGSLGRRVGSCRTEVPSKRLMRDV